MRSIGLPKLPALALLALWPASAPAATITFNVNDTADRPDDIQNGVCADAFGKCTLRAAIMEANLGPTNVGYVINLPAGTYTLTRAVTNPDDHSNGDLDVIAPSVTIHGAGSAKTIIDANHVDRAFRVANTGLLELDDVTIRNGQPSAFGGRTTSGGAILNQGSLGLYRCVLDSNTASSGGGVAADLVDQPPFVLAAHTTFSGNIASYGGGGFSGYSSNETFDACTFSGNAAQDGGGVYQTLGTLSMQNTTFYQNDAAGFGGGINVGKVNASLYNMTFGGNSADSDQDGLGLGGGLYVSHATVTVSNSMLANLNDFTQGNDDCYTDVGSVDIEGKNMFRSTAGCSFSGNGSVVEDNPLLLLLKDNGGFTKTELPVPYSLTVNAGPVGGCFGISGLLLTEDQRGVKRPIGARCDMGATELEPIGDANGDGAVTVNDVFYLINYLFAGGPIPKGRGNVNGDGLANVSDVFYLINYLFAGGAAPI